LIRVEMRDLGLRPGAVGLTPRHSGPAAIPAPEHATARHPAAGVTPVRLPSFSRGKPIKVGANPQVIAITPNRKSAYVVNNGAGTVTPITLRAG